MTRNYDRVVVFGLGFVGLPLALSFSMRGVSVIGVDIDESLVQELSNGVTYHLEEYQGKTIQEILKEELAKGTFQVTTDAQEAMKNCTNFIVTVGIPVIHQEHSMGHLQAVCQTIATGLKPGDLVLIRSTVIPGTVRSYIAPILESSGLQAGVDFHLAYASERIAEGKAFEEFENMPTLVSGLTEADVQAAQQLLQIVTKAEIYAASSVEVVETAKVLENVSRDINIAMVNEFAKFTKALGIDIFEVIRLANTHKRVKLLQPGPGVGGYCIPNAYYYLEPKARELGVSLDLSATGRRINQQTPQRVAQLAVKKLPVKPVDGRICILGMAMKDFSSDDRLSPALDVIEALQEMGVTVKVFDPAIPKDYEFLTQSLEEAMENAHGIIVLARQNGIDFADLSRFKALLDPTAPFILDTRNVYRRAEVEHAGFVYESL